MTEAHGPPLRLVFVTSIPRWGGGERWMLDAAAGLAAQGHHVLVAARRGAAILRRARERNVPCRDLPMGGDFDPRALWAMFRLLRTERPDAVFVNLDKELRYVCLASPRGPRPFIFPRRGSDDPLGRSALHRWTWGRRATRVLTNSAHVAAHRLTGIPWLPRERVRVMPNGVPPFPRFDEPTVLRRRLRLPRPNPLLLHVGELEARKGQQTTLDAFARLLPRLDASDKRKLPYLAFLGTGPDEVLLRDHCHALGIQDRVVWLGFRADVDPYLAAADLFVLPSRREGSPWSVLEAMAAGLPVIASHVNGIPEVLEHGVEGLLVPPDDPGALADAMQALLGDPERSRQLGAAAAARVQRDAAAADMLADLECLVRAHRWRERTARGSQRRRPALFVDRDGTLVRNVPYNGDPDQVTLQPHVGRALRWVTEAGIPIHVITNQSGVARGLLQPRDVEAVHERLAELLAAQGVEIAGFAVCPHHPDVQACTCRKPQPGLLEGVAASEGLDLSRSLMVGDAERDLEAGRRAGCAVLAYAGPDATQPLPGAERRWLAVVQRFLGALDAGAAPETTPVTGSRDPAAAPRSPAPVRADESC